MTTAERLALLDQVTARAWDIIDQPHHVMHDGKPVLHPDTGQPLDDPWPTLHAIDTLIRASELRARILGLDREITE